MTSNTTNVVTISKTCIAGVENGQDIQYHNIKATTELKWQMSGNSTSNKNILNEKKKKILKMS